MSAEVNANLNDRERAIIGKIKEAAKAYDSVVNPETGKIDESAIPSERLEDIREFNRSVDAFKTGDPNRDRTVMKAIRDSYLTELADRMVRSDAGWEFKGVGAGIVLLFGILPIKAFVKANFQKLSARVVP